MKIEIYHKIIDCLESIRMHLKLSQLKFAAYFSFIREGYRLVIAKDTNKNKTYVKIELTNTMDEKIKKVIKLKIIYYNKNNFQI